MLIDFFGELGRRNRSLFWFGWLNVGLLFLALVMMMIDQTTIMGINAWIKPMKFAISITIYSWTFGWMLYYSQSTLANRLITLGLIVTMLVEIVLIYLQAFRGTTSHFNIHSAFDGIVFGVMGIFIGINTLVNFCTILLFFSSKVTVERSALWAWRFGLVLFFLGSLSGGWMVSQLAHTVGAMDGGPGLPLVNWSTTAGDIRAAHFITLHGLQAIPLAAWILRDHPTGVRWSMVFTIGYAALCIYLHLIAFLGIPVIRL